MLLIGLLCTPVYVHYMGLAVYGVFALLNSIVAPMGWVNVSFGRATIKYVAESAGAGNERDVARYLRTTLLFNGLVGLIGTCILIILAPLLTEHVFKIDVGNRLVARQAIPWTALSWLVAQVSNTYAALPIGMQKYKVSSLAQSGFTSLNIISGIAVLSLGGGLIEVLQAKLVCNAFGCVFWIKLAHRMLPGVNLWPAYDGAAFRKSFGFSIWQIVAQIGGTLSNQADKWVLGTCVSSVAVGAFNVPATVSVTSLTAMGKVSDVLFPAMSHMQGRGEEQSLVRNLARSGWVLSLLTVVSQGTIFILAPDFLKLYIGSEVANSAGHVLRIFSLTAILNAPSVGLDPYLLGTARTHWNALIGIITGVLTLVASAILVPRYGLAGAAWSDLVAIVASRPIIHYCVWRQYLRPQLPLREFLASFYSPVLVGLVLVPVGAWARSQYGAEVGLLNFIIASAAICLGLAWALVLCDFFPARSQRRQDLLAVIRVISRITSSAKRLA